MRAATQGVEVVDVAGVEVVLFLQPLLALAHTKVNALHSRLLIQIVFALVLVAHGVVVRLCTSSQPLIAQLRLKTAALLLQRWLQAVEDCLRGRVGIGQRGVVVAARLLSCNASCSLILQPCKVHACLILLIQQRLLFRRQRQRLAVQRLTRASNRLAGLGVNSCAVFAGLTVRQRPKGRVLIDTLGCGSLLCQCRVVRCLRRFALFSHISLLKSGNRL